MCEDIADEEEEEEVKVEEEVEGAGSELSFNKTSWNNRLFSPSWRSCSSFKLYCLLIRGGWDRGDRGESEMSDRGGRGGYR